MLLHLLTCLILAIFGLIVSYVLAVLTEPKKIEPEPCTRKIPDWVITGCKYPSRIMKMINRIVKL